MSVSRLSPLDPNSFSRPGKNPIIMLLCELLVSNFQYFVKLITDEVKVTHMDLELDVNFADQTLSGQVVLSVEKVNLDAKVLVSIFN